MLAKILTVGTKYKIVCVTVS